MGNENRFKRGNKLLVEVPIESSTVVEKGDLVMLVNGKATTPSQYYCQGNELEQASYIVDKVADYFIGVADTPSANGDDKDLLVDISMESIYELKLPAAAALSFGDYLGIYASSTASASYTASDYEVEADNTDPIAICMKERTASNEDLSVLVKFMPNTSLYTYRVNG